MIKFLSLLNKKSDNEKMVDRIIKTPYQEDKVLVKIQSFLDNGYILNKKQWSDVTSIMKNNFYSLERPSNFKMHEDFWFDLMLADEFLNYVNSNLSSQEENFKSFYMSKSLALEQKDVKYKLDIKIARQLEIMHYYLDKSNADKILDVILDKIKNKESACHDLSYQNKYIGIILNIVKTHYSDVEKQFWEDLFNKVGRKNVSTGVAYRLSRLNQEPSDIKEAKTMVTPQFNGTMIDSVLIDDKKNQSNSLGQLEQQKVSLIEEKIKNALLNKDFIEEKEALQNILKVQLPSIVGAYLSVEPEFRHSLRDENGNDAQQLFEKNLKMVDILLFDIRSKINKKRLMYLSKETKINERYMKKALD